MTPQPPPYATQTQSKPPWGKIILFGCGVGILLAAGVVVAIYYGFKYAMRSSPAFDIAVTALKQSQTASKALGDIKEIGTPGGSVASNSGGTGAANLSMSVTGTQASGEYYATLYRKNGQWYLESGRLELSDGRSITIQGRGAIGATVSSSSGGRQLSAGQVDTSNWTDYEWPQQQIKFKLPPGWLVKKASQRELDCRFGEQYSTTYLAANAWIWDRELPADGLVAADLGTAAETFKNGVIDGYATRDVGGSTGVITISTIGGKKVATWKAIINSSSGQKSIDISLATEDRNFANLEATFNTIFDTFSFQ